MKMKSIIHAAYECLWKFLDTFFLSSSVCHRIVPKEEDYQTMAPKIIKYSQCCSRIAEEGRILCLNFFKREKLIPWRRTHIHTHTHTKN